VKQTTVLLLLLVVVGIARADSLNVRSIGSCMTGDLAFDVAVSGDYAYVADYAAGLCVISVVDPEHPDTVGHLATPSRAVGVTVVDSCCYVAIGYSGLLVASVADPSHPVEIGRFDTPGIAFGVSVVGDLAYVADGDSGLQVISVADPANPVRVGSCGTPGQAKDVAVLDDYVYIADDTAGLRVISVTDPSHPFEVGFNPLGWALGVAVSGDYAYVASYAGGLRAVSVIDPAHPREVGNSGPGLAQDVAVKGEHVYVAANTVGLHVVSATDPTNPTEVGHHDAPGMANCVVVAGHYAYVAAKFGGFQVFQFYGGALGDLDVDGDSLDVRADTITLLNSREPGAYGDFVLGEFVLANTGTTYNPDTADGPSTSPLESLTFVGSLTGPGGTLDSVLVLHLPASLAQGQSVVCTLAVYVPGPLPEGDRYFGAVVIAGYDSLHHLTADTIYAAITKLGDIDVVDDSLDIVRDTIRLGRRRQTAGPPPKYSEYAAGAFVLVNTGESYNPDTTDGPSLSPVESLSVSGSLAGPGGTLDSIVIPDLPDSLPQGWAMICTLEVWLPPLLPDGDYVGSVTIAGRDSAGMLVSECFYALVRKRTLGDLDVDGESLDVRHDTMGLRAQPAGPVYSPYAKAEFMLVNTYEFYNPDREDGPSNSPLYITGFGAYLSSAQDTVGSIYVTNLPESLAAGQAVECTLALVVSVGTSLDDYSGLVTIDAYDTVGYRVRDSFFLTVRGPEPRENLDSLRVAPIPFKPNQNPEHDAIHFQGLSAGARVIVYDASGLLVWNESENGDGHIAWKAEVASGIYVYLVVSADGKASKVGKLSVIR